MMHFQPTRHRNLTTELSVAASPGIGRTPVADYRIERILTRAARIDGPNALITPEKSVSNMLEIIDHVDADDSGEFFEWDGGKVPW